MKINCGVFGGNAKRRVILIVVSFALAFFIEFISGISLNIAKFISSGTEGKIMLQTADFVSYNEQDSLVSKRKGDTAVYSCYSGTVRMAILNLEKSKGYDWVLQVYFGDISNGNFSEKNMVGQSVFGNQKSILIPVLTDANGIYMNLGNEVEDSIEIKNVILNPSLGDYFIFLFNNLSLVKIIILCFLLFGAGIACIEHGRFQNILYKYRWAWGGLVITVCVILKVHGSSIGILFSTHDNSLLWGTHRAIRSDEYAIFTEMALSQAKTGFQWFSDTWGYTPSDMFIVYGQPVHNLVTLYRPFSVGYIFLGAERGLSFYWCSRIIVCFLASFEFGRLFTHDKKKLSVSYALIVTFSPIVQWWFSINELVEMIIFGQLAVVFLYQFIISRKTIKKIVIVLGLILCAGGYVLALYPAWMVPLFYVFLAAAIAVIIENRKNIVINKQDVIIFVGGVLIFVASFLYIYMQSKTTLSAVMNTVYPGSRRINGGNPEFAYSLLRGWTGNIWSFTDIGNPCEAVTFFDIFPLGIILSGIIFFRKKRADVWLITLNISNLIMILYSCIGFPSLLANITLLSFSTPKRAIVAIGFINLVILVRALSMSELDKWSVFGSFAFALIVGVLSFFGLPTESEISTNMKIIIVGLSALVVIGIMTCNSERRGVNLLVVAIFVSVLGVAINPISSGLSSIYQNPLLRQIELINTESEGMWAVIGSNQFNNCPTIMGAKTINAVQTYPDRDLFEKLGVIEQEEIWNRYAYLTIEISTEGETYLMETESADAIKIHTTIDDLRRVGVKYLLTTTDFGLESNVTFLYGIDGWRIYRVNQNSEDNQQITMDVDFDQQNKQLSIQVLSRADYDAVRFAVWGDDNGQNDLIWYNAKPDRERYWCSSVDLDDHDEKGVYIVHAYGYCGGETGELFSYVYKDIYE